MQSLPFDIFETIIDSLAEENDTDSLKATSLVCHSVLPRCRKYLFYSVKIDLRAAEKCLTLLSPQTDIPKYIRRLEYTLLDNVLYDIRPALLVLLERISGLQSLTLQCPEDLGLFNWVWMMDSSLQSALLNLMHLPTLTHLCLVNISNFHASDLFSSTSLRHLQLDYVSITDEPLLPSKPDIFPMPRIQEVTLKWGADTIMEFLTAKSVEGRVALDLTNLKTLSMVFVADIEVTRSFLKEFNQVEELRLEATNCVWQGLPGLADMEFHTFGTTLCLTFGTWGFTFGIFEPSLYYELAAMDNNTLRTLKFNLLAYSTPEILDIGIWEILDEILSSPRWSCLENIFFDIEILDQTVTRDELTLINNLPSMKLTRLSRRPSLNLKFSLRSR